MYARLAISALLISIAVVFAYHELTLSDGALPADADTHLRLARVEARLQELGAALESSATLRGRDDVGGRLAQLERRLADLEARGAAARAGPTDAPVPEEGEGEAERGAGIADAAKAKARAENLARATSHQRERIQRLDPDAAEADLDAAAALLAEYARTTRDLYQAMGEAPPDEREALERRRRALRDDLQTRLRAHLADDVVDALTRDHVQNR